MQHYLGVKILDLDSYAPKSVHELSKGIIVCLLQTDKGGRGHAVRLAGGILRTKLFNEGVEVVYGPWWESTVSGQCRSLEGCREDTM